MKAVGWVLVGAALLARPLGMAAQEAPRLTVRVRQAAGSSVYLDAGTRHGLATGDTVPVARDSLGVPVGALVVTASTGTRSVLTFAGEAIPVARGETLTLLLRRAPQEALPAPVAAPAPRPTAAASGQAPTPVRTPAQAPAQTPAQVPARASAYTPRPHGRVAMDMSAIRSVTRVGGSDPIDVERLFATPALRMDVTAPGAVAGFTLRTSARLAYRYSDGVPVEPPASARVYAASLERDFTSVPLRMMLGRFYSPVEQYSGVWDGMMFRVGHAVGVGGMVGFEPDRWNERPSTRLPKATAFVDWRGGGRGWRWSGDLSGHTVRPADSVPSHSFVGATQRVTLGPLYLSHDLQLDQDPTDGAWRMSRLRVRGSLDLSSALELRAGFSRRESYVLGRPGSPFAPRNDRLDAGVAIRAGGGFLSADASVSEDPSGDRTQGVSAAFASGRLPALGGVALAASGSRWSGPYGNTVSAAPGLNAELGDVSLRLGYRFNRSDYLDRTLVGHGADASLDAPLGGNLRVSVRGRYQWGGVLMSQGLDVTLYRIF